MLYDNRSSEAIKKCWWKRRWEYSGQNVLSKLIKLNEPGSMQVKTSQVQEDNSFVKLESDWL